MLEGKKESVEFLTDSAADTGKWKFTVLIEPNLYRDVSAFMKELNGTLDVEDQYGELVKGAGTEETSQEYMQLLENYEKMQIAGKATEENKLEKSQKASATSMADI